MVYGGVNEDTLSLNEDTLYAGQPGPCGAPKIHQHVDRAFELIQAGKYAEAEKIVIENMLGRNHHTNTTLGNLRLKCGHGDLAHADYRRELDTSRAIARVSYRVGDATFTREMSASAADSVLVVRLTSDRPSRLRRSPPPAAVVRRV